MFLGSFVACRRGGGVTFGAESLGYSPLGFRVWGAGVVSQTCYSLHPGIALCKDESRR